MDGDVIAAGFSILFVLSMFVFSLGFTVLWIWMIIDCATKEPSEGNDKIIWILIIVLTGWIGALIYMIFRRPARKRQYGQ